MLHEINETRIELLGKRLKSIKKKKNNGLMSVTEYENERKWIEEKIDQFELEIEEYIKGEEYIVDVQMDQVDTIESEFNIF